MITEEIRSYEVSIWTLQDEFLTVLKWSDIEQKGTIQNPKITLNIDGTQNFDFSIPMQYRYKGKMIDNPGWCNTQNGNLIEGMRKIKVIFNKKTDDEAVYEFLIVNTEEVHEKDMPICNVKCEGLAFHELGKRGYKISLSQANFEEKYKEWAESDGTSDEPIESLDYWCNDKDTCNIPKRPVNENEIDPNTWYYIVTMNHQSFKNVASARANNKVYETPYATSWSQDLTPQNFEYYQEKARPVSIDKSNLYNITQTIAEAFEIHCTYKYTYDENYHITSRTIVFYNHFFQEEEGAMSFTYPYSSSKITRINESKDLTTKLYVLTADNDNTVTGYNTIMNAVSNLSKEDYILNFDYMHDRKIITDEQYDLIKPYEAQMHDYNNALIVLQQNLSTYEIQKPELEAKIAVYKKSIELDQENLNQANALRNTLDIKDGVADGYITVNNNNPDQRLISQDIKTGQYYINLTTTNKGIVQDTIEIYRTYNTTTHELTDKINTTYSFRYDEFGRVDRIYGVAPTDDTGKVYLTYKYNPNLYYDAVAKVWNSKLGSDTANYAKELRELGPESTTDEDFDLSAAYPDENTTLIEAYNAGLNKKLQDTENSIKNLINEKSAAIKEFERVMGPALREGYWQPENYQDYGNHLSDTQELSINHDITDDSGESFIVGWDEELFEDEEKNYYENGVELTKVYYPCIDLSYKPHGTSTLYDMIKEDIMNYSFIFNNNYLSQEEIGTNDVRYTQIFSIGSQALLQFGLYEDENHNKTIHPLLVLVGAKSMTNDEIAFMKRNTTTDNSVTTKGGNPRLGIIQSHENGTYSIISNNLTPIDVAAAFVNSSEYTTVYPRIKFSSLNLRANSSDFFIYYNGTDIEIARDYIIQTRNTLRGGNYYPEYYLTVFPTSIYKGQTLNGNFEVHYVISNADNSIYLDALEVSKENAYPKVEYTVEPTILNRDLSKTLYSKLATLVMINDVQLKFENVFGYISQVELDLDNVSKDKVEIKNYKTKFEDLFSTIVAQTEDMKRDGIAVHAAAEGNIALTQNALEQSLEENYTAMQAFLNSYFDSSDVVREKLESLFTEAGEILSDSTKSLNQVRALSTENAAILSNFAQTVSKELSTKVVKSPTKPTDYKPGDVWIQTDGQDPPHEIGRYVATSYSNQGQAGGTSGFVRTFDGTLASITGTSLDINADAGKIKLTAANNLYLASNQVDIVGNNVVNIGGATVNIVSLTKDGTAYNAGGINLIAGAYQSNGNYGATSRVLISPTLIEMGAATLRFKAASSIDMVASTGTEANTSTITLNPDTGIWIGSGKSISLFSGNNTSGSNVQLTPTHIIMGVSSGTDTTAFEIQKDFLIMATGTTGSNFSSSKVTLNANDTGSLIGMKLTKDSFGLAVVKNSVRTVILANSDGITLGTGENPITNTTTKTGSYVKISGSGIEIGSLGKLYVNMTNFKLQTDNSNKTRFAVGENLNDITADTTSGIGGNASFVGMVYNTHGLFVNGNITASSFIASGLTNTQKFKATSTQFGFYNGDTGILTIDSSGNIVAEGNLTISSGKTLTMSGAQLVLSANDNKFIINSSTSQLYLANNATWASATDGLSYSSSGLAIKGAITATSFNLSGDAVTQFNTAVSQSGVNFGVDGISKQTWNNGTYVSLTSTAGTNTPNSGILIGVDESSNLTQHIIVPYNANTPNTVVDISKNGIYFDHYNSTPATINTIADNYIHMDTSGIEVKGSRISINGDDVWARDDIVVMNSNIAYNAQDGWRKTVESIEAYMMNGSVRINDIGSIVSSGGYLHTRSGGSVSGDWVLVRPYYDAVIEYKNPTNYSTYSVMTKTTSGVAFGTLAPGQMYNYKVIIDSLTGVTGGDGVNTIALTFSFATEPLSKPNVTKVTIATQQMNITNEGIMNTTDTNWQAAQNGITVASSTNLCEEGKDLYYSISVNGRQLRSINFTLRCEYGESAYASARVPCTVYYYPVTSN